MSYQAELILLIGILILTNSSAKLPPNLNILYKQYQKLHDSTALVVFHNQRTEIHLSDHMFHEIIFGVSDGNEAATAQGKSPKHD